MPGDILIGRTGFHVHDRPTLVIDRPQGSGDWLFIIFHRPVRILEAGHRRVTAGASWVLYAPTTPQHFDGDGRGMLTSWFHARGAALDRLVRRQSIPCDHLQNADGLAPIEPVLRALHRERLHGAPGWEAVTAALASAILIRAGAAVAPVTARMSARGNAADLRELRERLHDRCAQRWTLAGLARLAGVSPSRLVVRWRQAFGISPIEDLLTARLARAAWMLESTSTPVHAVAQACGFSEPCHFSRLFRARLGCPPTAWARRSEHPAR